jgi:hypothetical protein
MPSIGSIIASVAFPVVNAGGIIQAIVQAASSGLVDPYPDVAPSYKINIVSNFYGNIVAIMQDDFHMEVESQWDPFFQTLTNSDFFKGLNAAAALAGRSAQNTIFSRRIWVNTTPLKMSVPLVFAARINPVNEVLNPVKQLQALALPGKVSSGWLVPPGPSVYTGQGATTISIGTFMIFKSVIIQKVDIKFSNRMSAAPYAGIPMSAEAIVHFETYEVVASNDLDDIYNNKGTSTTAKASPASGPGFNVPGLVGAQGPQGFGYVGPTFKTSVGT